MMLINTIVALTAVVANVQALGISHPGSAHHHDLAARVASDSNVETLDTRELAVEDALTSDLEERVYNTKVGLAWNNGKDYLMPKFKTSKTKYIYTWSPWCPKETKENGLTCCPMLWGWKQVGDFQQQKHKGGKCLMGPNEPNEPGQSNMSPQSGVKIWNEYIRNEKKNGYRLITPAVTSGEKGVAWMQEFFDSCGGKQYRCGADVLAFHYYGTSSSSFKKWANRFHDQFGLDIWVTEIACQNFSGRGSQCSQQDVWDFMGSTTAWMTKQTWIQAYFFFGLMWDMYNVNTKNRMVSSSGYPNDLGKFYLHGQ